MQKLFGLFCKTLIFAIPKGKLGYGVKVAQQILILFV